MHYNICRGRRVSAHGALELLLQEPRVDARPDYYHSDTSRIVIQDAYNKNINLLY